MRKTVMWLLVSVLVPMVGGSVLAQEGKGVKPDPAAAQQAAMEAWMKAATPGEPHKFLEAFVGNWDANVTSWEAPGAPARHESGFARTKWVLGGRFVQQTFRGQFGQLPYEGLGLTGYDNMQKKYTATWMDSLGTMTMFLTGTLDPATRTLTMTGTIDDVVTGKPTRIRTVSRVVGQKEHRYELYGPDASGNEFKKMEIVYTPRYQKKPGQRLDQLDSPEAQP